MSFVQPAPQLADPYRDDRVLQAWLARVLPEELRRAAEADFIALAQYARSTYARQLGTRAGEPLLTQWDVWGNRVDRIELTETWREGPTIAARHGLVADGHDRALGEFARVQQFAKVYLYHAASAFYSCPLAMTDGVATALRDASNAALRERILPRLLSRDPATFWISGQWMTENAGGSDVAMSETAARRDADGTLATGRPQVVHVGDQRRVRTGAGASRGQPRGRGRARAVRHRDPQPGRDLERHHHRPPEGQAGHARTADRGNPSVRHARGTGRRLDPRRARDHAGAAGDPRCGTHSARSRPCSGAWP